MNNYSYIKLEQGDNPLKIDKDLIEVQKTIIFYNEKILEKLNKLEILLKEISQINKEVKNIENDPINQYLKRLIIPRGN